MLAWVALYDATTALLKEERPDCVSVFGWRAHTRNQDKPASIGWHPGDPQGLVGDLFAPSNTIVRPNASLATLKEQFTIFCHARPPITKRPAEEIENYAAARALFDAFMRAVTAASFEVGTAGRLLFSKLGWELDKNERPMGATIRVLATLEAAILRTPIVAVPVAPTAVVKGSLPQQVATDDGPTVPVDEETQTITKEDTEP